MTTKNPNLRQLFTSHTFADMIRNKLMRRIDDYQLSNPQQELYTMAWGDTTKLLSPKVAETIVDAPLVHQQGVGIV